MGDHPTKTMRRRNVPATARFLTFSCYQRRRLFDNDRIKDQFVVHMQAACERHGVRMIAWVVMPEHVHLIVFPFNGQPLTAFLTTLKRAMAVEAIKRWRELEATILLRLTDAAGDVHFWQAGGGYDRNVIGTELVEKIQYMHQNPVRRGLASHSATWVWSSARAYDGATDVFHGPEIAFDLVPRVNIEVT